MILHFAAASLAGAGTTQAAAAPITTSYVCVSVMLGATGAVLPGAVPGARVVVAADGANGLTEAKIYPAPGQEIYLQGAGNQGVDQPADVRADECIVFECAAPGKWYGFQIS